MYIYIYICILALFLMPQAAAGSNPAPGMDVCPYTNCTYIDIEPYFKICSVNVYLEYVKYVYKYVNICVYIFILCK